MACEEEESVSAAEVEGDPQVPRPPGTVPATAFHAQAPNGSAPAEPKMSVELHKLPLDEHGWIEGRQPSGNPCLYVRDCPNTTDCDELRSMLQQVRDREQAEKIPSSRRLFPDGKLRPRACYIFCIGLHGARWELRARSSSLEEASRRCKEAGLNPPTSDGLVLWKATKEMLLEAAGPLKLRVGTVESGDWRSLPDSRGVGRLGTSGDDELSDPVFFVANPQQSNIEAWLSSGLQAVVDLAKREGAALLIPDYVDHYANHIFHQILLRCDFTGPVIHMGVSENTDVAFHGPLPPKPHQPGPIQREYVYAGASHAFLISGDFGYSRGLCTCMHGRLGASIARAISGHSKVMSHDGPRHTLFGIVTSGGVGCLFHLAEQVRQQIPILVMQGSGRLSDYLPVAYLKRASRSFDVYAEAQEMMRLAGFNEQGAPLLGKAGTPAALGMLVKTILSGNLTFHQLSNGTPALTRILHVCFVSEDDALREAQRRHSEYIELARKLSRPDRWLHVAYLVLSVGLTLLATLSSQELLTRPECIDEDCADVCELSSGKCHPLQYVVSILPLILSIVLSMRVDMKYDLAAKALMYAAALVERAIWEYCTRSGEYSDLAALEHGGGSDADHVAFDTTSMRAKRLTQKLVDISEEWLGDVPHRQGLAMTATSKLDASSEFLAGNYSIDERGCEYVAIRVQRQYDRWSLADTRAEKLLLVFKMLSYFFGAGGTILALMGHQAWVTVTTAFVASLAAWNSRSPIEQRMRRARDAARVLNNVMAQWAAVPIECRGRQAVVDTLVHRAETAILAAEEAPPANYKAKLEDQRPLSD